MIPILGMTIMRFAILGESLSPKAVLSVWNLETAEASHLIAHLQDLNMPELCQTYLIHHL